ncbi:hypothetical protein [Streptomyces sp. NPDC058145]|uniref:hypothetical protein n=1 Tax=Streptomyces sp. NPDC058145 TaxID=3346356 RepID=UPI0036E1CEF5
MLLAGEGCRRWRSQPATSCECPYAGEWHGQALDEAAAELGVDLRAVWVRARTDTRLAVALAGRDPDALDERGHALRADYLRLLALGLPPSRAELILGTGDPGAWRGDDPAFAAACDAVSAASALIGQYDSPVTASGDITGYAAARRRCDLPRAS